MTQEKGIIIRLTKWLTFVPAFLFMVVCGYGQDGRYNYDRGANSTSAMVCAAVSTCT